MPLNPVFDGHVTTMSDRPRDRETRKLQFALAALFSVANAALWLWVIDTGYLLPLEAYADPAPPFTTTASGAMQFDMCSHCGRGFVLAGREPNPPIWLQESQWVRAGWTANIPSMIVSKIAGTLVEDAIGQYGAMWAETATFATASTAQWSLLGWSVGGIMARLASARLREQQP